MAGPSFLGLGPLQVDSASNSYFLNGSVGIGTATPAAALDINYTLAGNPGSSYGLIVRNNAGGGLGQAEIMLAPPGGASTWTLSANDGQTLFRIFRGSTADLAIDASGRVGIGTTAPGAKLDVAGDILVSAVSPENPLHSGLQRVGGETILWYGGGTGSLQIKTGQGGGAGDRVTITSAGNLGIGTANPGAKLDVAGRMAIPNFGSGGAYQARKDDGSLVDLLWVQNDASYQNGTRLRSAGGGVALHNLAGTIVMYVAESGAVQVSGQQVINASGQVLYA